MDMERLMLAAVRLKTKLFGPRSWSTAFGSKGGNSVTPMQLRGTILVSKEIYARGEIQMLSDPLDIVLDVIRGET